MARYERMLSFIFGGGFCAITLIISAVARDPSEFTKFVLRASLALGAAGVAALVFGRIQFKSKRVSIGASFAMFFSIYLINPPQVVRDRLETQAYRLIEEGAYLISRGNASDGIEKIRQAQGLGLTIIDIPYYLSVFERDRGDYSRARDYANKALDLLSKKMAETLNVTGITVQKILLERAGLNEELARVNDAYLDAKQASIYAGDDPFLKRQSSFTRGRLAIAMAQVADGQEKRSYLVDAIEQLSGLKSEGWPTGWAQIWGPLLLSCAYNQSAQSSTSRVDQDAYLRESVKNDNDFHLYVSSLSGERKMEVQLILSLLYRTAVALPSGFPIRCDTALTHEIDYAAYRPYLPHVFDVNNGQVRRPGLR